MGSSSQTQSALMYGRSALIIARRRILNRISSSIGRQCSISLIHSDTSQHFGWLDIIQEAQLRTDWSWHVLNLAVLLGWSCSTQSVSVWITELGSWQHWKKVKIYDLYLLYLIETGSVKRLMWLAIDKSLSSSTNDKLCIPVREFQC